MGAALFFVITLCDEDGARETIADFTGLSLRFNRRNNGQQHD